VSLRKPKSGEVSKEVMGSERAKRGVEGETERETVS
jgi:hypothetical protein